MERVRLSINKYYHLINHGPCCLVTTGNQKHKNIAPISWITPLNDDPPLVISCIASDHYTSYLINIYKEFVINIPTFKQIEVIKYTGKVSGRDIDKFSVLQLKYENGKKVKTVHLEECVGFIEVKLVEKKEYDGVNLYIGKVVYCEVNKDMYDKFLIPHKARTVHHIGGGNFFISSRIMNF
ncbi:MAG: flavin reductase family protein [Endomicrobia bacterium]|nr:flavin reductase family protein [Endomicrobiia bacterium]